MRQKTNIEAAIQHLQIARNLLEAESTIEQNKGKGRTNWGRVGTLNDFKKQVEQILSSDHGECGIVVYNERFEKNRPVESEEGHTEPEEDCQLCNPSPRKVRR